MHFCFNFIVDKEVPRRHKPLLFRASIASALFPNAVTAIVTWQKALVGDRNAACSCGEYEGRRWLLDPRKRKNISI